MSIYAYYLNTIDNKYNINGNNYDVYKRQGTPITTYLLNNGSYNSQGTSITEILGSDVILFRDQNCMVNETNPPTECVDTGPHNAPMATETPKVYLNSGSTPNTLYYIGQINSFSFNNQVSAFHPVEYMQGDPMGADRDNYGQYYMVGINLNGDSRDITFTGTDRIIIDDSGGQNSFFDGKNILNDPDQPTDPWAGPQYNICHSPPSPPNGCTYPNLINGGICTESCVEYVNYIDSSCSTYYQNNNLPDPARVITEMKTLCSNPVPTESIYSSSVDYSGHCLDSTRDNKINTEDLLQELQDLRSNSGDSHPCGYDYKDAVLYYNINYNHVQNGEELQYSNDHCSELFFLGAVSSPTRSSGSVIQKLIKGVEEKYHTTIVNHDDLESNVIPVEVSNTLNDPLFDDYDAGLCQEYNYLYDIGCLKRPNDDVHHPLMDRIQGHCSDLLNRPGISLTQLTQQEWLNSFPRTCSPPPDTYNKSGGILSEHYNYNFVGSGSQGVFNGDEAGGGVISGSTNNIPCPSPYQGEFSVTCPYTLDPGMPTFEFTEQCSNQEYMNNLIMGLNSEIGILQASASAEFQREENLRSQRDAAIARAENLRSRRDAATARAESDGESGINGWLVAVIIIVVLALGVAAVYIKYFYKKEKKSSGQVGQDNSTAEGTANPVVGLP